MTKPVLSRKALLVAGGLAHYLRPKIAQDAQLDLPTILKDVSAKNYKEKSAGIVTAITAALDGKLAKDASLADIGKVMDEMADIPVEEGADADPNTGLPMSAEQMAPAAAAAPDPIAAITELLRGKLDDATLAQVLECVKGSAPKPAAPALAAPAADEDDDDEEEGKAMDDKLKNFVPKAEMEKAVKLAEDSAVKRVSDNLNGIAEATAFVRPWVGELALACDSAVAVYHAALKAIPGVIAADVKDITDPNALRAVIKAQPLPGVRRSGEPVIAADAAAAAAKSYAERFPGADRIGNLGN